MGGPSTGLYAPPSITACPSVQQGIVSKHKGKKGQGVHTCATLEKEDRLAAQVLGTRTMATTVLTHMDIFLPKLLAQALRQRAQRKLGRRKRRRGRVATQRRRRAGEQERAAFTARVERLPLERADRLVRERKSSLDVRVRHAVHLFLRDLHERFPDPEPGVE